MTLLKKWPVYRVQHSSMLPNVLVQEKPLVEKGAQAYKQG